MKYNCLIVDDEPLAQDVLETHISKVPDLHLVRKCSNAFEALEVLHAEKVDIIFLDIQMPELTGLEFLKTLQDPPAVIFTTAYSEFAVEGFELNALDYLMKPISFERFYKSVNKAIHYIKLEGQGTPEVQEEEDHFFVKADKKIVKISLKDILYIEGLKDYVMIYTTEQRIITLQTMKNLEERLPSAHFQRVHRSFIISIDKLKSVSGNFVEIGDKQIPVGKHYKDELMKFIDKHNLIK